MVKTYLTFIFILLTATLLIAACSPAATPDTAAPAPATAGKAKITVSDFFARATTENGAVYMTLKNEGPDNDALIGAETDVAKTVELHKTTMGEGDMMKMQPVATIPVPAGGSVKLEPGGLHVMLIDMQKELTSGDKIKLTLKFEKAEPLTIEAEVKEGEMMGNMENGQTK